MTITYDLDLNSFNAWSGAVECQCPPLTGSLHFYILLVAVGGIDI